MSGLWRKACEAAEDARLLYRNERFDGACNRAYYAMFNAARALAEAEQTRGQADYSSRETEIEAAHDVMGALDRFMAKAEQVMTVVGGAAEERDNG